LVEPGECDQEVLMSPFNPCFASILLLTASLAACDEDQPAPTPRVVHDLRTTPALAAADVDRAIREKLADEQRLPLDVEVPSDADEVRYLLFAGELAAPPATFGALKAELGTHVMREVMHGGQDARRSVVFRDVAEGTYTV